MPKATVQEFDPNTLYPLPEGVFFPATLLACDEIHVDKAKTPFWKWEWTLVIDDGEFAGTQTKGSSEAGITNASDSTFLPLASRYVEALLGRPLELGEAVDTDDLLALSCQISVRHQEPRPRKNGDGFWYNVEIDEILPANAEVPQARTSQPTWGATTGTYDEPPF